MSVPLVSDAEFESVTTGSYAHLFELAPKGKLRSVYLDEFEPVGWIGLTPTRLFCSSPSQNGVGSSETTTLIYKEETAYKFLTTTLLELQIPEIKLKTTHVGTHRFKLVEYIGYKITTDAEFRTNEAVIGKLDTFSQIALFERMAKPGNKAIQEKRMGKNTVCAKWTNHMKATNLYYPQQWGYSFCSAKAFPIYLLNDHRSIYHRYEMSLDIKKHINMQEFDKSTLTWKDVEVDMSLFDNVPERFAQPSLYGTFANASKTEMLERTESGINTFYVFDMINCDAPNKWKPGTLANSALKNCPGLVQTIFWALENVTHEHLNITCNYTRDALSHQNDDPDSQCFESAILTTTINTDTGFKFDKMPSPLFDGGLSEHVYPSSSGGYGILTWHYVENVGPENNGGSCPQKKGTKISCNIAGGLPKNTKFKFRFRALVIKEMTIQSNGAIIIAND